MIKFKITLYPIVLLDIEKVWRYSYKNYGKAQADKYKNNLKLKINELANHPYSGVACDNIKENYKKLDAQSHIIFYFIKEETIFIAKILHKSMDSQQYFKPEE